MKSQITYVTWRCTVVPPGEYDGYSACSGYKTAEPSESDTDAVWVYTCETRGPSVHTGASWRIRLNVLNVFAIELSANRILK